MNWSSASRSRLPAGADDKPTASPLTPALSPLRGEGEEGAGGVTELCSTSDFGFRISDFEEWHGTQLRWTIGLMSRQYSTVTTPAPFSCFTKRKPASSAAFHFCFDSSRFLVVSSGVALIRSHTL